MDKNTGKQQIRRSFSNDIFKMSLEWVRVCVRASMCVCRGVKTFSTAKKTQPKCTPNALVHYRQESEVIDYVLTIFLVFKSTLAQLNP